MSSVVWALYDTRGEAERAVRSLTAEVALQHAGVYDSSPESLQALRSLDLSPADLAAAERKLSAEEHLLLVRAETADDVDRIISVLERQSAPETPRAAAAPSAPATAAPSPSDNEQERAPPKEEGLRVGTPELVRGGARIRTPVEEIPEATDVELLEEILLVEKRSANRPIDEQELQSAGLMRGRVIEIAQSREEAVVTKQAFVREEVIVTKTVERRVEQIHGMLRHTGPDTADLAPGAANERRLGQSGSGN